MAPRREDTVDNKLWRLMHFYQIVDKNGLRDLLTPNIVQRKMIECEAPRKMVLKARQFGVSTIGLLDIYDDTIYIPDTTSVILAHENDAIEKLFRIPRRAYEFAPSNTKPVIDRGGGSKYEMFFPEINSRIYCDLEVRGDTIHRLHASEVAFMKDEKRLLATLQAVPMNGKVCLESTANGIGGLFYDMWNDPKQPYAKLFFPWFIFPEYAIQEHGKIELTSDEKDFIKRTKSYFQIDITLPQIAFRRFKQTELKSLFLQEYPEDDQQCFLASASAAMDLLLLNNLMRAAPAPIYKNETTILYKPYNKTHIYACGADTAEGVGGDWSIGSMFDTTAREQVGIIAMNRKRPEEFADALAEFCMRFTTSERPAPLLGVERNNHGHAVLQRLDQLMYPNLFYRKMGEDRDDRPGWVTDKVTRPLMIDVFIEGVENRSVQLYDRETFRECMTLVNNEGKVEAAQGKHDDRVIAGAIGVQMMVESSVSALYDNISDKILI